MKTLLTIVEDALRAGGFEGLYNPGECACELGDLFPCEAPQPDCRPGVKVLGCDNSCPDGGCDWHIMSKDAAPPERSFYAARASEE